MKELCLIVASWLLLNTGSSAQNVKGPANTKYFPIAVWLQDPANAMAYKEAGINMYVGIWRGLDDEKLSLLKKAGMKVICDQNAFGLKNLGDKAIYGWMHGDEPDNAQMNRKTGQYDPCIDPALLIKDYNEIRKKDPTRPVYINLGQGVAYINYIGRGKCRGDINKYKVSENGYLKACDIASFDIYPVNNTDNETMNNLWYVAKGIDSLRSWSGYSKPVWCWIECTKIAGQRQRKPTPAEVRAEVWMALIHGANGFGYFCHSFNPPEDDAALLHDAEMLAAVKAINSRVTSLSTVLNSPDLRGYASVESSNAAVPVHFIARQQNDAYYLFSAGMRCGFTTATFKLKSGSVVEVLDEGRTINIKNGSFSDSFSPYEVHLYRIK